MLSLQIDTAGHLHVINPYDFPMSTPHKIAFALLTLLWLGLAFLVLDLAGITLYNILVVLVAGGLILMPLWKRWGGSGNK